MNKWNIPEHCEESGFIQFKSEYNKHLLVVSLYMFLFFQEHKKVLYYFPKNADIDTKVKHVGLCEAIVTFTQ